MGKENNKVLTTGDNNQSVIAGGNVTSSNNRTGSENMNTGNGNMHVTNNYYGNANRLPSVAVCD